MTVPEHIRVVARGNFVLSNDPLKGIGEDWSMSWKFSTGGPGQLEGTSAQDVHVDQAYQVLANYLDFAWFADTCNIRQVTSYLIGTDGRMVGNPNVFIQPGGTEQRGAGTNRFPPQVALVVTSVAANRGPARFGRFFLPGVIAPLGNDLRISAADATTLLTRTVDSIKLLSDTVDLQLTESANLVNISAIGAGTKQNVDHLELGRAYDTHRSRRRNLKEDRVASGHIDW